MNIWHKLGHSTHLPSLSLLSSCQYLLNFLHRLASYMVLCHWILGLLQWRRSVASWQETWPHPKINLVSKLSCVMDHQSGYMLLMLCLLHTYPSSLCQASLVLPQLTFNQYALSMNGPLTYTTLYSHHLFGYNFQFSNENWLIPCGKLCPSAYKCIYGTFAILPFCQNNSTLIFLHLNTWWQIRTDCMNLTCPFQGTYIW